MSKMRNKLSELLARAQRRFNRARPGSVLIMVVSLLVLLALIGTAAMSTARIDRGSSRQHISNTQIDLLVEGIKTMAASVIVDDLFNFGLFRDTFTNGTTYDTFDGPSDASVVPPNLPLQHDAWLASRQPILVGGRPIWPSVTFPLMSAAPNFEVSDPRNSTVSIISLPKGGYRPDSIQFGNETYPALRDMATNTTYMAADADGDGIADSFYVKMPVGTLGGVTYYYAVRIIDNNSAINVNTALSRNVDYKVSDYSLIPGLGLTPAGIAMIEFIRDSNSDDLNANITRDVIFGLNGNTKNARLPGAANRVTEPLRGDDNSQVGGFHVGSVGEAMYMTSGRRLDNPGFIANNWRIGAAYAGGEGGRPFGLTDAFSLADRFVIGQGSSPLELALKARAAAARTTPYPPGQVNQWYADNFDFSNFDFGASGALAPRVRSYFTTHNPTANMAVMRLAQGQQHTNDAKMPTVREHQTKISLNHAGFGELWKGFYDLMCWNDPSAPNVTISGLGGDRAEAQRVDQMAEQIVQDSAPPRPGSVFGQKFDDQTAHTKVGDATFGMPYGNRDEFNPGRMFRSVLRTHSKDEKDSYLRPADMVKLRSAIAATNLMAMRRTGMEDSIQDNDVQRITLGNYTAEIYGYKGKQPFITEVFIHTDITQFREVKPIDPNQPAIPPDKWPNTLVGKTNPEGFVAIELYNPYDERIDLNAGYGIVSVNRKVGNAAISRKLKFIGALGGEILPKEHIVLTNYQGTGGGSAQYVPMSIREKVVFPDAANEYNGTTPATVGSANLRFLYVPDLGKAIDPQDESEIVVMRNRAGAGPFRSADLATAIPLDSFDAGKVGKDASSAEILHYSRAHDPGNPDLQWACAYPGRYDGSKSWRRHQGTQQAAWDPSLDDEVARLDPWWADVSENTTLTIGKVEQVSTRFPQAGMQHLQIPLHQKDTPGPFGIGATPRPFPYGGFARPGDVMHVPFIGRYRIIGPGNNNDEVVELNSITMDAVFAEDTDVDDDRMEDVGRMSPLIENPAASKKDDEQRFNDFYDLGKIAPRGSYMANNGNKPTGIPVYHYRWATRIYDIFTVINNPWEDTLPNGKLVPNGAGTTEQQLISDPKLEETMSSEGLINVNTASWPILAAVPWVPPSVNDLSTRSAAIAAVAKSIVWYRDGNDGSGLPHGSFKSMYELYRVPIYENFDASGVPTGNIKCYLHDICFTFGGSIDADDLEGDLSPFNTPTLIGDKTDKMVNYREKHLSLNRVSNLLTFQSDTYTVYVLVQGWRDAETANAKLEVQRRAGFIIDRSRITGTNKSPKIYNIPSN